MVYCTIDSGYFFCGFTGLGCKKVRLRFSRLSRTDTFPCFGMAIWNLSASQNGVVGGGLLQSQIAKDLEGNTAGKGLPKPHTRGAFAFTSSILV